MTKAWMPLYIGDYLADTMHLSAEEHGAYLLLMIHYWRCGPLPANSAKVRKIAKLSAHKWKNFCPLFEEFFTLDGDVYRHKRIDEELAKAAENREKKVAAANARWSAAEEKPDAPALQAECPSPSPSPITLSLGREAIEEVVRAVGADPARDPSWVSPGGEIRLWLQKGADFEADVLPTLKAKRKPDGVRAPPPHYFTPAVLEAAARRKAVLAAPEPKVTPHEQHRSDQPRTNQTLAASLRGLAQAAGAKAGPG